MRMLFLPALLSTSTPPVHAVPLADALEVSGTTAAWTTSSLAGSALLLGLGAGALLAARRRSAPAPGPERRGAATGSPHPEPEDPAPIAVRAPSDLALTAELRAYVEALATDPALGAGRAPTHGAAVRAAS